jgi:hypothetical protein
MNAQTKLTPAIPADPIKQLTSRELLAALQGIFTELSSRSVFGDAPLTLDERFSVAETAIDELVHDARSYLDAASEERRSRLPTDEQEHGLSFAQMGLVRS